MKQKVLPLYYDNPDGWWKLVLNSMNEVVPFFDSDRMVTEYYERIYA
jgi:starch phosphorylase